MHRAVKASYDKCNPVSFDNVLELEYGLTGEGLLYADPRTTSPEFIYEQKLAEDMLPNLIPLYPPAHRPAILALVMRTEGYAKKEIVASLGLNEKTYRCKIHNTVNKIRKDSAFMQYVEGLGCKRMNTA